MSVHGFTVYDMICRGDAAYGDAPAVIQGERQWSFREFRRRVDSLAAGLHGLGVAAGDRIAILAQNDAAYLELYGACARQGIVAYPINWRLTAEEVERVVGRAEPRMMVVDASTSGLVSGWLDGRPGVAHRYQFGEPLAARVRRVLDALRRGRRRAGRRRLAGRRVRRDLHRCRRRGAPRRRAHPRQHPHRQPHGHRLHRLHRRRTGTWWRCRCFTSPPSAAAMAHMHAGGALVIVSRFDADEAVRLIDRHRVTHVSDFPPVLVSLLDAARKAGSRLPSLRHVSGLDAPATIQRLHEETGAKFWTGFGQSETSGFVTLQRVSERPGASGRVVPAAQVKLVDDYDRDVPVGTPGEIVVRGPLVFQGYFAQPDVTAHTFRGGWHHTGDVGRFDADGYLHYVKRKPEKELIKPGGENVYPAEVESVIMQMDGVSGVCVFGIPDVRWGEAIKAVVEVKASGPTAPQQVIDFVGAKIARFKRPQTVVFTDALPRGADGSVDRDAVKTRWGT